MSIFLCDNLECWCLEISSQFSSLHFSIRLLSMVSEFHIVQLFLLHIRIIQKLGALQFECCHGHFQFPYIHSSFTYHWNVVDPQSELCNVYTVKLHSWIVIQSIWFFVSLSGLFHVHLHLGCPWKHVLSTTWSFTMHVGFIILAVHYVFLFIIRQLFHYFILSLLWHSDLLWELYFLEICIEH